MDIRTPVWFQSEQLNGVHEFIDYFRNRFTNVYVTFLDASKAFDRTLFRTLECRDASATALLAGTEASRRSRSAV